MRLSMPQLTQLIKALRALASPISRRAGLCDNVDRAMFGEVTYNVDDFAQNWLRANCPKWPEFSGSVSYPVKHPRLLPREAFYAELDLWVGEYGANRHALRLFLLARAEKQLLAEHILVALKRIKVERYEGVPPWYFGICVTVKMPGVIPELTRGTYGAWLEWALDNMQEWPEYSGHAKFPVPSGCDHISPEQAYYNALDFGTMWDSRTPYGAARWRLLDFLINRAEKEASGDF